MRPYLYIAKVRMLSALAYRFDVLSSIVIQCLAVIASCFFWIAAYGNQQAALGVTRDQMLTYTVMSSTLACLLTMNVENRIAASVQKGSVALDLLKPVNIFGIYLWEDIGSVAIAFLQNAVPLLLIGALFIVAPVPASAAHFLLFILSAAFSYMINWLIAALFGMWSFRIVRIFPLLCMKGHMIRLLSGSVIPLWFFPQWLQTVLSFLPFRYIYQLPLSVYIGILSPRETAAQMGIQFIWILLLGCLFFEIKKGVTRHLLVQGG